MTSGAGKTPGGVGGKTHVPALEPFGKSVRRSLRSEEKIHRSQKRAPPDTVEEHPDRETHKPHSSPKREGRLEETVARVERAGRSQAPFTQEPQFVASRSRARLGRVRVQTAHLSAEGTREMNPGNRAGGRFEQGTSAHEPSLEPKWQMGFG